MKRRFVDTSIFLRYLTKDDPSKYERCRELFTSALDGKITLVTSGMVIAELIWTLLSYYKVPKAEVVEKVSVIAATDQIYIPDRDLVTDALALYRRKNIDYIDAFNAVLMRYHGLGEIYSYDEDFDTIEGLKREEP